MIEPYLQKITPKQFFTVLGVLVAAAALTAAAVLWLMIALNFNFLEWME